MTSCLYFYCLIELYIYSSFRHHIVFLLFNRPFCIAEGEGFRRLATKLIAIGAQYGSIDSSEILSCATTISCHLSSVVEREQSALITDICNIDGFGVTTDMWTHGATSENYITVTVQYVEDW